MLSGGLCDEFCHQPCFIFISSHFHCISFSKVKCYHLLFTSCHFTLFHQSYFVILSLGISCCFMCEKQVMFMFIQVKVFTLVPYCWCPSAPGIITFTPNSWQYGCTPCIISIAPTIICKLLVLYLWLLIVASDSHAIIYIYCIRFVRVYKQRFC